MSGDRMLALLRTRVLRPWVHRVRRPFVLRALRKPSELRLLGLQLRTDPRVFHPVYFHSSLLLSAELLELDLLDQSVLDMGTGSGVIAAVAASRGAKVTACDVNPHAVALARANALRNHLAVEVLESNLFGLLAGRRFDLICFNVPFYARAPQTPFEAAYFAGPNLETVTSFARECGEHLLPDGQVVIVFSEDCDRERILLAFTETGLSLTKTKIVRRLLEDFHVAWFSRSRPDPFSSKALSRG
jgi:release factor glutamine methyltransferase